MCLDEFDHLGDSFGGKDGQQVSYEQVLESFAGGGCSGAEFAESDALAIIGASSAAIDKRRMESVHVEVLTVDEEAFTDSGVPVIKCMHIEPTEAYSC